MQELAVKPRSAIDIGAIYAMRRSGATLQQIASKVGRTKERIRQILLKKDGSTRHKLISTNQLFRQSRISRYRVIELYNQNIITPAREWDTGIGHHLLWYPDTIEQIQHHFNSQKLCRICSRPIPASRRIYCSDECYQEGHKYKYKNPEDKKKHLECVRKYRERCSRTNAS